MDLQKLIEQRDKLIADVTARLEGRGAAVPPVEIQQAQMQRVEERIESLALMKETTVKHIDAELEALKSERTARDEGIKAEILAQKALAREAAAAPAPTPDEKKKASPSSKAPKSS